jgi:hypothetical protein
MFQLKIDVYTLMSIKLFTFAKTLYFFLTSFSFFPCLEPSYATQKKLNKQKIPDYHLNVKNLNNYIV